ncbi:MAG TPA: 4-(cytidine 5'-diphospho)-2-C-methyl-D-erythritol kinase [Bacteroidia bacterium]|nr:4-(cytidine 5'-diphospho)-2-C-methyl-D-erythritol kinase [Bacteroidia bacterium]
MIVFPNAKINIGLNIIEKRSDGFHNIESIFYPIGLCDILEVVKNNLPSGESKINFSSSGILIPGNTQENLCVKAFYLLDKIYTLSSVNVHLHKIIPIGAGLGGGSSDAVFLMKALNELFDLKISEKEMQQFATQLGSDCSFFVKNEPVFAEQKGEVHTDISLDLSNFYCVLVYPKIHINTAFAYSETIPKKNIFELRKEILNPVKEWKKNIFNDFESSVFKNHTEIKSIKEKLYELGASYVSMSGSGSAVYGIFEKKIILKKNIFQNCFLWEGNLFRSKSQQE